MMTLITGGARSGKTRHALSSASAIMEKTYIATAQLLDDEMRGRALRHRQERGDAWRTIEEPYEIAGHIESLHGVVVVDCLTLWLSNWLLRDESRLEPEIERLCAAFRSAPSEAVAITNEVGLSVVPDNALARRFRDWSGLLNQRVAAAADRVWLMVCGIAVRVK